jgi:hypothetical protein
MRRLSLMFAVVLSGIIADTAGAAILTYVLQPGATITRYEGSVPIGPTESMSGTFSWVQIKSGLANYVAFDATALDFQSASYHLTLNTTVNNRASSARRSPQEVAFGEIVDAVGLSTTPLDTYTVPDWGTYDGPAESPTVLTFAEIRLGPPQGGPWAAKISFTAVQVPEPTTLALLFTAFLGGLLWWRRRR